MSRRFLYLVYGLTLYLFYLCPSSLAQFVAGKTIKTGTWRGQRIEYVEGQILIEVKPGVSEREIQTLLFEHQARIIEKFHPEYRWGLIEVPKGVNIFKLIEKLKGKSIN